MNTRLKFFSPRHCSPSALRAWIATLATAFLLIIGLLGGTGCSHRDDVKLQLQVAPLSGQEWQQLEIRAQVAGTQTGLRYKWIADVGQCDPQESEWPSTMFRFANGSTRDWVTAEVWRDNRRVAHQAIEVVPQAAPQPKTKPPSGIQVEITSIPPSEPGGGPNTRADIAGRVIGEVPPGLKIVIYARASEVWYIQPIPYVTHTIQPDLTWSTWTHTGSHYAALLVRSSFVPVMTCDLLPPVDGEVIARSVVEGVRK